jgi:hypothetical protein
MTDNLQRLFWIYFLFDHFCSMFITTSEIFFYQSSSPDKDVSLQNEAFFLKFSNETKCIPCFQAPLLIQPKKYKNNFKNFINNIFSTFSTYFLFLSTIFFYTFLAYTSPTTKL